MGLNKAKIIKKNQLTYDVLELDIESENEIDYEPGQFITFKITDEEKTPCFRAYSIASAPQKNKKVFELIVKIVEGGRGGNWFQKLKEGDEVEFMGPNGKFTLPENQKNHLTFIATGTGIAPFKAMIEDLIEKGFEKRINLIFGVRHEKDIIYKKHFQELAEKNENFTFDLTLSQPENEYDGNEGRVTTFLDDFYRNYQDTDFYICGLKNMVDQVHQMLLDKEVNPENIHFEKYD